MQNWRRKLPEFLDQCWRELADFETPRSGVPGLVTLATIAPDGPECRTVVLRRVDRFAGTVETFCDIATPKIEELRTDPHLSVLVWQPLRRLQIRLRGTGQIESGAAVLTSWEGMPENARKNYGVTPSPGTIITDSDAYERRPKPDRLANITLTINEIDVVHLDKPFDIRARFRRSDAWQGNWLSP